MTAPPGGELRRAGQEAARPAKTASQAPLETARARAVTERDPSVHVRATAIPDVDAVDFAGADGAVLAVAVASGITLARAPQGGSWRVTRAEGNQIAKALTERGAHLEITKDYAARSEVE